MAGWERREPRQVRSMFDGIAWRYDALNHLLSANADRGWRRAAAEALGPQTLRRVLDLCGGTGDLSLATVRRDGAQFVVCCDFSGPMLERAGAKFRRRGLTARCLPLQADALRLPFRDATYSAVTIGFGLRNLADPEAGLREMHRVLEPGGRLVVLEFSAPGDGLVGSVYRFYLTRILPRLGDGVARRRGPYGYLARTIVGFPDPATLAGRIREAGFAACGWRALSGGIVALHTAIKAASPLGSVPG